MTLKRINCTTNKATDMLAQLADREHITDADRVYAGEHPNHGHTIMIVRTDGSAVAFADGVAFLKDGSAPGD